MTDMYILDEDGNPVPCEDVIEWARWFSSHTRTLAHDFLQDGTVRVSTVFLGIDHNFGRFDPVMPVLWETMIFGGRTTCTRSGTRHAKPPSPAMRRRSISLPRSYPNDGDDRDTVVLVEKRRRCLEGISRSHVCRRLR